MHLGAMGMLFQSVSSSPPSTSSTNVGGGGRRATRELAAPPPPTLFYTNVGAGLFNVIMTTPDSKLDDLLWYAMPNLVRLAHSISNEELVRATKLMLIDLLLV